MDEQTANFIRRCEEIQKRCACVAYDAKECMSIRNPADEWDEPNDQECECACHEEIAEEEGDQLWP
jgi:hypothetical protein